ncbi:MAG: hypothetical protein IT305_21610 [Chloroflexi bacterium]|nr:hypothetical protein [Chloroflexota bacterium]
MTSRKPRRHAGEHDLLDAFDQPGCPVCRLASEAVDAYMTSVCYEQVNDLDLREQLRQRGGFCRPHAYRFLRQPLGQLASAIVYRDVLNTARKRIAATVSKRSSLLSGLFGGRAARRDEPPRTRCPGCEVQFEAEERHLGTLTDRLTRDDVLERYQRSDGLCLPHLERALIRDSDGSRRLADAALASLEAMVADLDEYIRKHDYRFQTPVWDGNEDAPERGVQRAVGQRAEP